MVRWGEMGREMWDNSHEAWAAFGKQRENTNIGSTKQCVFKNYSASPRTPAPLDSGKPFLWPGFHSCKSWKLARSSRSQQLQLPGSPPHPPYIEQNYTHLETPKTRDKGEIQVGCNQNGKGVKFKWITLRKFMDGKRPHNVSRNGDICLHCRLDTALKWTTEAPVISNYVLKVIKPLGFVVGTNWKGQMWANIPGEEIAALNCSRPDTDSTSPPNFKLWTSSPRDFFIATWAWNKDSATSLSCGSSLLKIS